MTAAFTVAPSSERTLDAGAYLLGSAELALIVCGFAFAAWQVRATVLAGWSGAPARVVEAVVAIALLIGAAELLGTFAAFEAWTMILAGVVAAAGATWARGRWGDRAVASTPPAPPSSRIALWLAAVAVAVVAAAWMVPTLGSLAGGMDRADTLWYHMPLATRFAHGAHFGSVGYFDPIFFASYYPANSEVVHAVPILAFDRDIISPLLNLAWLALGLTAAYSIGRPYGLGPQSLIGGAIALGAQNLVEFQAGEALNDIVGVSLILACVAVLVNASAARTTTGNEGVASGDWRERVAMRPKLAIPVALVAIAGLAAGLAAGTKLSFLAPVIALFVGLIVIAPRGWRLRTGLWFAVPAFLTGGYWFVRNLVAVGNPIPFTSFGPLGLPTPERAFELRPGFSVFHYATDFNVWSDWFFPGLDDSFGFLWPLVLAAFLGGAVYALWRGADPLLRVLGGVVLFTAVAYVFTPLTAAGEEGQPIAFVWNVRYIAPAAAVGLAILPCLPIARRSERARGITLAGLAILFAATAISLVQWKQGHVKGAIAAGVIVFAAFAAIQWWGARTRWSSGRLAAFALVALAVLGAGWWEQRHYLERRYENLSPQLQLADAARWARDLRDAKVAISGVRGVFNQFPFYGTDLSNEVQWLGVKGPDGAYERIPTCAEWRQALADGGYTHVVTTYDPFNPGSLTDTKEALWTREDPAAKQILRDGPVSVFELTGPPDPSACDDLPDLTPAELNGDSVNEDPTANQPR
ncbi:MAG: hypothetical protein QOI10_115 [Solirubrobacterales bacterium]|jgi:hypothetical protein|nr:hypothetical protein [Solirubrobacterales bacterium]